MMKETQSVRAGEEIDVHALQAYLRDALEIAVEGIMVEQFPAGSSNLTYLVRVDGSEYVLRRPPFGNTVKSAHDMGREFGVLSKLSAVYAPAPKPLLYCEDAEVIGSKFYLMERRRGTIIRGRMGSEDLGTHREVRLGICKSFIRNLADLHALDLRDAGLEGLGRPEGYCRRQVDGWSRRYETAKTDEHGSLETAIRWLQDNIPTEWGASLIHNDYKFDNIMLDPADLTQVTAVLDWEMVTVGDPMMDLGTTLGYWMSWDAPDGLLDMPFNPRVLMTDVTRSELVEMYRDASGRDLPPMLFYYVFGTFKIAVIAQQIYARYARGATRDARFAGFNRFVGALGQIAEKAVEKGII